MTEGQVWKGLLGNFYPLLAPSSSGKIDFFPKNPHFPVK